MLELALDSDIALEAGVELELAMLLIMDELDDIVLESESLPPQALNNMLARTKPLSR